MPSIYTLITEDIKYSYADFDLLLGNDSNGTLKSTSASPTTTSMPYIRRTTSSVSTTTRKGLRGDAIVGIVIGSVILFGLISYALYDLYRRRKHAKPTPPIPATVQPPELPSDRPPVLDCRKALCTEYLATFKLPNGYFNGRYDKCLCQECHNTSNPNIRCGNWCTELHGWVRLGLRPSDAHANQWRIFEQWHTSYYGTTPDRLRSILSNRFIPFDNDGLPDGTKFNSGHHDQNYCITSPSLAYASRPEFSPLSTIQATDGNHYEVQVVLQCKQKPETIIDKDEGKPFETTEWTTKARASLVPFGLLIRLYKI